MPGPEKKFRQKRHPHCPECKYDLIATVETGRRICPECGYEFEMYELSGEKRPGEWTIWIGLRRALFSLTVRSFIVLVPWIGIIWVMSNPMSQFGRFNTLMLILLGIGIGYAFSSRLSDHAGFTSFILMGLASLFACGTILAGVMLVSIFYPIPPIMYAFFCFFPGITANVWILKVMILDE